MIAQGADPDYSSPTWDVLTAASYRGYTKVVVALLEKGASVNLGKGYLRKDTPLIMAASNGHLEVVSLLLDKGAHPLATNRYGRTALDYARAEKHAPVVSLLEAAEDRARAVLLEKEKRAEQERIEEQDLLAATRARAAPPPAWSIPAPGRVMHMEQMEGMDSRLMDIFNFETRERLVVTKDLRSGIETPAAPVCFDAVSRPALEQALAEFTRLGGVADAAAVFKKKLSKPQLAFKAGE